MPRKRDPNRPKRERALINTAEQINFEIKKIYRLQRNKQITAAEAKSQRDTLVALRAGLPQAVARPENGGYGPTEVRVFSVPSGYFLSHEQIEAQKRGQEIVPINQCTPLLLEHEPLPAIELAPVEETALPSEEAVIDDLKSQINELAQRLGVSIVV